MSIYEVLKGDHNLLRQWLTELEIEIAAVDVEGVEPAETPTFDIFARFLLAHSKAEEKVLYDRLKKSGEIAETVFEGQVEHQLAESVLKAMQKLNRGPQWNAHFKVLKEMVERHIEEEESALFKMAKKVLDREEEERIGKEMERRRGSIPEIQERVRGASLLHGSELHG